ncbi:MAG: alpha-galactosidase [Planctomycetota bacterium]
MTARIAFIGAGSLEFTRKLVRDVLTFPALEDAAIVLMDINAERLGFARRVCQRIIDEGDYPAKLEVTTDRKTALAGADAVLCTILCGDVRTWQHDLLIPDRWGVSTAIGDTRGPSGIFRFLRTVPTMLSIVRDVEKLCPNAIFLNYTNPMAMNCRALQRASSVLVSGLCHSVQHTAMRLASWVGVPFDELQYTVAGINHMSWFIRLEHKNTDLYPRLRKVIRARRDLRRRECVRCEMFEQLGYFVTESSTHNSEYNWWFRKRPDLLKKYFPRCKGPKIGMENDVLYRYRARERAWKRDVLRELKDPKPLDLKRGYEYAAHIINSYVSGEPFWFNGNVPNTGLIDNLPHDVCVEVPVLASRRGLEPIHVGPLPPQCAALNNVTVASEEMAVEAFFQRDPEMVYHAICYDPLTAAVLSLAETRKMVKEMFRKNRPFLKYFRRLDAWLRS